MWVGYLWIWVPPNVWSNIILTKQGTLFHNPTSLYAPKRPAWNETCIWKKKNTLPHLHFWGSGSQLSGGGYPFHSQKTPKDSGTVHCRVCSSCLTHGACSLGVSRRSKVGWGPPGGTYRSLVVENSLVTGFQPSYITWLIALSVCRRFRKLGGSYQWTE